MSKKQLSFLLSELKTLRIQCKSVNCKGAILEIAVEQLQHFYPPGKPRCPLCLQDLFAGPNQQHWLNMLAEAITGLQVAKNVEVEFIVQDKTSASDSLAKS